MTDYSIEFLLDFGKNNKELLDQEILDYFITIKQKNVKKKPLKFKKKPLTDFKELNLLLNKLSDSNLDTTTNRCIGYLDNDNNKEQFINIIFEAAISQPTFCNLYSKLLKGCNKYDIKTAIMIKCESFYNDTAKEPASDDISKKDYDLFCKLNKEKQKLFGCFSLIGELYIIDLITYDVLDKYLNILIDSIISQNGELGNKYIDCLSNLVGTIKKKSGFKLDDHLKDILLTLSKDTDKFKARYRFMLEDIYKLVK